MKSARWAVAAGVLLAALAVVVVVSAWGDYAVYRVLAPVRATLGLQRLGGDWRVDQAQAAPGVEWPAALRAEIVQRLTGGALA